MPMQAKLCHPMCNVAFFIHGYAPIACGSIGGAVQGQCRLPRLSKYPSFSVQVMRLRDENEALMETLVRAKVELAETQGETLLLITPVLAPVLLPNVCYLIWAMRNVERLSLWLALVGCMAHCWSHCASGGVQVANAFRLMQVTT